MEQEAPPTAAWYNFLGWIETNKKLVARAALVLAALVAVGMVWFWYRDQRETKASDALSNIQRPIGNEKIQPGAVEQLLKLAAEYSGTPAAGRAACEAGRLLFMEGRYAEAQTQFERFLREYPGNPWSPQATLGVAASIEAQGKTSEAITRYSEFLARPRDDAFVEDARLSLARLYEASSQFKLAVDQYQKIIEQFQRAGGQSQFGQPPASVMVASDRARELFKQHPELRPTNAAPRQPTPPPVQPTMTTVVGTNLTRFTNMLRGTNLSGLTNLLRGVTNLPGMTNVIPLPASGPVVPTVPTVPTPGVTPSVKPAVPPTPAPAATPAPTVIKPGTPPVTPAPAAPAKP